MMNSVCLFASYFESEKIPYYITVYLKELKRQFTELYFLTSKTQLLPNDRDFLDAEGIKTLHVQNRGFDFGQWYQAIGQIDLSSCDELVLVNDSCILFKPLDRFISWKNSAQADFVGMTRSEAVDPHLQSYFLLIKKPAIKAVLDYFKQHGMLEHISEVIKVYEIGLSRYLLQNKFRIEAFVDNEGYTGEFSPYYYCVDHHLAQGIPLIKRKIIFASYRKDELFTLARMNFNLDPEYYLARMAAMKQELIIDPSRLRSDRERSVPASRLFWYQLQRQAIRVLRPIYKRMKRN